MKYEILQTISIICYMISVGFLAVSILIFLLWDMRDIIGRLTGSTRRRALEQMKASGSVGRTGSTVVDISLLEKNTSAPLMAPRPSRRSGRVSRELNKKPQPAPQPAAQPNGTPDYFGAPYPNKTPPVSTAPIRYEAQTALMPNTPEPQTDIMPTWEETPTAPMPVAENETMDLEQWQQSHAQASQGQPELVIEEDDLQPVELTILDDILFIHTETFIEI